MSSNQNMLLAVRTYLEKVGEMVGSGGKPLFYEAGITLAAGANRTFDVKTKFPNHVLFDLRTCNVQVLVLDTEVGKATTNMYVNSDAIINIGINAAGVVVIENASDTPVTILYKINAPAIKLTPSSGVEFLGEVDVGDLINGAALASTIGLTAGTAQHSNEPWLHFILDGVELYVAKKPYRHSVSWDHINVVGAVFGTKTVEIDNKTYKVRLLKSVASGDIYTGGHGVYDPVEAYDSEWNRLFYPIHSGNHTQTNNPSPVSGEGLQFGTLAQYTDTDLVVHNSADNGSRSWCQETPNSDPGRCVGRGSFGVSRLDWEVSSATFPWFGWRPVLELIP